MGFLVRRLQQLRGDGGETANFTYNYVGDLTPPAVPHLGNWYEAEDHWQLTNQWFSNCRDLLPPEVAGDEARERVEKASIMFLGVLARQGSCWACPEVARKAVH